MSLVPWGQIVTARKFTCKLQLIKKSLTANCNKLKVKTCTIILLLYRESMRVWTIEDCNSKTILDLDLIV